MEKCSASLKVYFEDPFWVGIIERRCENEFFICKITFGAEPKDYEIKEFLLKNYYKLKFSNPVKVAIKEEKKVNPKRMQRKIKKQLSDVGIGTRSQQALKAQYEENKIERKKITREQKEEENERKFLLRQEKRKQKHRGK